jgi:hypothetical protein
MPQPFETGDKIGRMRVVERARHGGYVCRCTKCLRTSEVSGKALRLKHHDVGCLKCFPRLKVPRSEIFLTSRGYPTVNDREAA